MCPWTWLPFWSFTGLYVIHHQTITLILRTISHNHIVNMFGIHKSIRFMCIHLCLLSVLKAVFTVKIIVKIPPGRELILLVLIMYRVHHNNYAVMGTDIYIPPIICMYGYICNTSHESVCRCLGLSTFWSVKVLVCRRSGLSTFWYVEVLVCWRLVFRRGGVVQQLHCGETVTIIAVTIIQDGGRRRRWVRAGPDCDTCMPRRHI